MFNVKNYEYDCTRKCRLRQHGNQITVALTKRAVEDAQLAAYIAKTCCNYCDIVDDLGRSAVHLAASVDRYCILEWLLNQGAIINGREFESGSSPLHRALFYGCIDCAVLLLRYGASLELLDEDTRCALHSICRLRDFVGKQQVPANNEILVWGSNKNYNLGIGNEEGTSAPQSVEFFRKEHVSLEAVALGAYHSLFLDKHHRLYAVGHGKGGRLGIGSENSLATAKRVKLPLKNASEKVICISVSRKHSLLLTDHSAVFACGLNEDEQLGVRGAGAQLNAFKEVITLRDNNVKDLVRVIARDFHSMAYSKDSLYVWGSNHGQWGIDRNTKSIPLPTPLKIPKLTINFVEANNAATVVYMAENQILLYYNAKMRGLKPPNYEKLKAICIHGGDCGKSTKGSASALKLLMLTDTNVIFFWYEKTLRFYRCIFNEIRISQIDKIFYKANQVLILSQGDVYNGKCQQTEVPKYITAGDAKKSKRPLGDTWSGCDQNLAEISTDHMIRIDLQRIANIDRAVNIFCDDDFASFCVLQESQMKYFKLPTLMAEEYAFKKLYNEVSEGDAVHDLIFHVDSETFAAHKFIVYARAPGLREIIAEYNDKHIYLNIEGLTGKMFELMLKYMYTNYYPDLDDLDDIEKSVGRAGTCDSIVGLFLRFVERFRLKPLANFLLDTSSKERFPRLRRLDFPELYDVRVVCSNEQELKAHKCMLVARSEYFSMMFTHEWSEQRTINMSTVPVEYMKPILDFLYSSDVEHFRKQNFTESFLYTMIVFCDQFFIERLRKVCEILVLDKISIRKCGDMLDFAVTYNCEVMKEGCMNFICQNLARILCLKSLESCEPEALKCLNLHYRKMFKEVFDYRMITPDADAVDDDLLMSFVDDFRVDLDERIDEEGISLLKNQHKTKSKEINAKHSTRQYERDAILNMRESLSLNESFNESKSKNLEETQEVTEKLQAEAKTWMKVVDKRESKRKQSLEHAAKAIETLKETPAPQTEFVPLKKGAIEESVKQTKTPEREIIRPTEESTTSTPNKVYNLNLADFAATPKMSQKQRKRLSSGGAQPTLRSEAATTPIAIPEAQPNAWGTVPSTPQSPLSMLAVSPPTGSTADPSSFANMMRGKGAATPPTTSGNSFTKILAEERQQRDYNERQRNKSLVLTQIEETAIAELREFYNVDHVDDEHITIERKPMPQTQSFSSWRRN